MPDQNGKGPSVIHGSQNRINGYLECLVGSTILITGGNGFQARWLIYQLLELGCRIIGIVRNVCPSLLLETFPDIPASLAGQVMYEVADIRDEDAIRRIISKYKPDIVIHTAAQTEVGRSYDLPLYTIDVNVRGSNTVLEACRTSHRPKAVLVISSDKFYGNAPIPYRENDLPSFNNSDPYSFSKLIQDRLAQSYAYLYHIPIRVSRPANTFGPGQLNESTLITGSIKRILSGEHPIIIEGADRIFREYLYIENLTIAHLLLLADAVKHDLDGFDLRNPGSICFNIGSGETLTAKETIKIITELMGVDVEPVEVTRQESKRGPELGSQCVSTLKFRDRFPYWQTTPIREGLKLTIQFYQRYYQNRISLRVAA